MLDKLSDRLQMEGSNNYLIDMDGVLVSGSRLIPGADQFIKRLQERGSKFLLLTNNPRFSPRDLAFNLQKNGLNIDSENIFTAAMATARFLDSQRPGGTAYVIGESGLTSALHEVGYIITGVQSGLGTILTLSGVTQLDQVGKFPYGPTYIVNSVADIYP